MKIVEFRMPIPLKLADFQRCSIHLLIEASIREMEGGSGLEVFRNEMFKSNDRIGYYTEKRYHLAKNLPTWLQSILGTKLTILTEKSWNLYPKLFTKYFNEVFPTAEFSLQTENLENLHITENALNLSLQDLNKRNVIFVDLTKFNKLKNYDSKYDLTKFKAGNFLPLKNDWFKHTESVGMVSYKLLKLNLPQFGLLASKIESYIVNFFYESLMYYTCMGLCSYEKWNNLTLESLRVTENECYDKLNDAFRNQYSKSMDKNLKLAPVKTDKGSEIQIPKEISHSLTPVSAMPMSNNKAEVDTGKVNATVTSTTSVSQPPKPGTPESAVTPESHVETPSSTTPASASGVTAPAVAGTQPQPVSSKPTEGTQSQEDQAKVDGTSAVTSVSQEGLAPSTVDKETTKQTDKDKAEEGKEGKDSVRSDVSRTTYTAEAVSSEFSDDKVVLTQPSQELGPESLEMTGPVPVMSYDDSEFMDAVENFEDLDLQPMEETKKSMGLLDRVSSVLRFVRSPSSHDASSFVRVPSFDQAIQVNLIHDRPDGTGLDKDFYDLDKRILNDGSPNTPYSVASATGVTTDGRPDAEMGKTKKDSKDLDKEDKVKGEKESIEKNKKKTKDKELESLVSVEVSDRPSVKSTTGQIISTVVETPAGTEKESDTSSEPSSVKSVSVGSKDSSQKSADKVKKEPSSYDIPITFTGYLYKLGRGFSCWTWNLRYIIVCGFNLYYFDRKNDMRPKDTINLKNSRISWAGTHMNRPYVFSITTEDKMVYYWSADEEESVKRWILLLQVLCEESPPYIVKQLAYELTYHQNNSENVTNNTNKF